jgi:hypothetical protein
MNRFITAVFILVLTLILASPVFGEGQGESEQTKQGTQNEEAKSTTVFVEEPNIPDGMALLYLYSIQPFPYTCQWVAYTRDGPIAWFANETYFPYYVTPGKIRFWAIGTGGDHSLHPQLMLSVEVEAVEGQTYFLKGMLPTSYGPKTTFLSIIPREQARSEIIKCTGVAEQ